MGAKSTKSNWARQDGISLIAMAFTIMVAGLFIASGAMIYDIYNNYRTAAETDEKVAYVQKAMQRFFAEQGRYPCPAPLSADIDTAGYGVEVSSDCAAAGAVAGTFRAQGRASRWVRTGAVPVRTLGIADSYSHDGYRQRLIYAVTEDYAIDGNPIPQDAGAIEIIDSADNNATSVQGNVVQIVYSMGWDDNGAYGVNGINLQACDPAAPLSGENCDFDTDAIFRNTLNKSTNEANMFVHSISYVAHKHVVTCEEAGGDDLPKHNSFVLDTSGSMEEDAICPASMPDCRRIDVAHWAMRRVIPATIYNKSQEDEAGHMAMTGFIAYNNVNNVETEIEQDPSFVFFNPEELAEDNDGDGLPDGDSIEGFLESKLDALETKMSGMCPSGSTPLGIHIMAHANKLREKMLEDIANGADPDMFSKITVISDGLSNNGMNPVAAAGLIAQMRNQNPPINIQVDIIDVVGNPSLMQVSQATGGSYYRTDDPDALLDALYASLGVCNPYVPAIPSDTQHCTGNFQNN